MHKHPLVLNGFLRSLNSSLGMIKHDNNYSTSFLNGYVYGVNITGSNANIICAQLTEGVKIEPLSMRDMKRKKKKVRAKTFYHISPHAIDTSGTYLVTASYRVLRAETTFEFTAEEEGG